MQLIYYIDIYTTCDISRYITFTENVLYNTRISCDDETYKPKLYKGICETTLGWDRGRETGKIN